MEIYRLHENIGGADEEGNSERNFEKDPISAGFTLKAFSEVSKYNKINVIYILCNIFFSLFLGKMIKPTQNFNYDSLLIV